MSSKWKITTFKHIGVTSHAYTRCWSRILGPMAVATTSDALRHAFKIALERATFFHIGNKRMVYKVVDRQMCFVFKVEGSKKYRSAKAKILSVYPVSGKKGK